MDTWGGEFSAELNDRKPDLTYINGRGPSYPPPRPTATEPNGTGWNQGQSVDGDGINAHGKRTREDGYGYGFAGSAEGEGAGEMALAEDVGFGGDAADDPLVYGDVLFSCPLCCLPRTDLLFVLYAVNGQPMKFSQVTEDHHESMTEDEYTAYFEVYQARAG